jgi:uncharacterized Ntn-hydrolase superfamily protein
VIDLHTFSIVARDPATGEFGVAVATARPGVGSLVPWVSLHGAIATQARVNTDLGRGAIALLEHSVPVDVALRVLLDEDPERDRRQVHGVDTGRVFCHTGAACIGWCGHKAADDFSVAGNMLVGPAVLEAMGEAFTAPEAAKLLLAERLLRALEAGQAAGGDQRGRQSAALLVASPAPRMHHNVRVDDHADPVAELRRVHDLVIEHEQSIEREYGPQALRAFGRVKY